LVKAAAWAGIVVAERAPEEEEEVGAREEEGGGGDDALTELEEEWRRDYSCRWSRVEAGSRSGAHGRQLESGVHGV
jgi:hypothetical protein